MDNPVFHITGMPRLLDEYTQATASMSMPDTAKAISLLKEMLSRVEKALALHTGLPPEREAYRTALGFIMAADESEDVFQLAHEAITPYTEWRAVIADLGFNSPADRAARGDLLHRADEGCIICDGRREAGERP